MATALEQIRLLEEATLWILWTSRHSSKREKLSCIQEEMFKMPEIQPLCNDVCKADTPRDSKKGQQHKPELGKSHNDKQQHHIKRTTEESTDSSTSSDNEFFCQAVRHLKQVKKIKSDDKDRTLIVKIDNVNV